MFKGRQFDRSVTLLCVRRYLAYNLSLRDRIRPMLGSNLQHQPRPSRQVSRCST